LVREAGRCRPYTAETPVGLIGKRLALPFSLYSQGEAAQPRAIETPARVAGLDARRAGGSTARARLDRRNAQDASTTATVVSTSGRTSASTTATGSAAGSVPRCETVAKHSRRDPLRRQVLLDRCDTHHVVVEIPCMDESLEMPDTRWSAWAKRHAAPVRIVSFIAGAVAVGYLWAVLFGDGIKGLQSAAQLNNSSTFPNANAAWCGSIALLAASLIAALMTVRNMRPPGRLLGLWLGATVVAGAALFALSRLFI
jgi:hypothetical protein